MVTHALNIGLAVGIDQFSKFVQMSHRRVDINE
jgi:hypothetical protein